MPALESMSQSRGCFKIKPRPKVRRWGFVTSVLPNADFKTSSPSLRVRHAGLANPERQQRGGAGVEVIQNVQSILHEHEQSASHDRTRVRAIHLKGTRPLLLHRPLPRV